VDRLKAVKIWMRAKAKYIEQSEIAGFAHTRVYLYYHYYDVRMMTKNKKLMISEQKEKK
jgi:hypothetical protein